MIYDFPGNAYPFQITLIYEYCLLGILNLPDREEKQGGDSSNEEEFELRELPSHTKITSKETCRAYAFVLAIGTATISACFAFDFTSSSPDITRSIANSVTIGQATSENASTHQYCPK